MLKENNFTFIQNNEEIHDQKFETKRIGYLKDALNRFKKNKGSVVAFIIITILILFSVITPMVTRYKTTDTDLRYANVLPKAFENKKGFWDGTKKMTSNEKTFDKYYYAGAVVNVIKETTKEDVHHKKVTDITYRIDTYEVGYVYLDLTTEQFNKVWEYNQTVKGQDDKQILYPLVDKEWYKNDSSIKSAKYAALGVLFDNANYYYKLDNDLYTVLDNNKEIIPVYQVVEPNSGTYVDENGYVYARQTGSTFRVRVHYREYYKLFHDGKAAKFAFGADHFGRDILVRLASGGRLSLMLGFVVSLVNLLIGIIYGSIEGYFGGLTDLIMERISEILSEVPTIVVVTLLNLYLGAKFSVLGALFIAYILTGWIGTAGTTRMQIYRYKGQEYVLAARTLGANDFRIVTRHIFPNAVGPIITGAVLMIPGVIFSESMLSYLNIINLASMGLTSIGTMLDQASGYYKSYPHELFFPAVFISLLMICFNIFGNGLRDAFNPSLRGVED